MALSFLVIHASVVPCMWVGQVCVLSGTRLNLRLSSILSKGSTPELSPPESGFLQLDAKLL